MNLQEQIRKVLKETHTDKMVKIIEKYLSSMYPKFNKKEVYVDEYNDGRGFPIVSFSDIENGIFLGKYHYGTKELELSYPLFSELESTFSDNMEYVIDWFNNEFDLEAEYVTF
jgi:hypothetical protein